MAIQLDPKLAASKPSSRERGQQSKHSPGDALDPCSSFHIRVPNSRQTILVMKMNPAQEEKEEEENNRSGYDGTSISFTLF